MWQDDRAVGVNGMGSARDLRPNDYIEYSQICDCDRSTNPSSREDVHSPIECLAARIVLSMDRV